MRVAWETRNVHVCLAIMYVSMYVCTYVHNRICTCKNFRETTDVFQICTCCFTYVKQFFYQVSIAKFLLQLLLDSIIIIRILFPLVEEYLKVLWNNRISTSWSDHVVLDTRNIKEFIKKKENRQILFFFFFCISYCRNRLIRTLIYETLTLSLKN